MSKNAIIILVLIESIILLGCGNQKQLEKQTYEENRARLELSGLQHVFSDNTPLVDLKNVENKNITEIMINMSSTPPKKIKGIRIIQDDGKTPGMVLKISILEMNLQSSTIRADVTYRLESGDIATEGISYVEMKYVYKNEKWKFEELLRSVIK